jgi:hypothetical protein
MTTFSDYIQKQSMASTELPLVHTTEYFRLASIQASNMLQTDHCSIFKEPLLYFFYGRPAYRDSSQTTPTRDVGFYPICFVFGPPRYVQKPKGYIHSTPAHLSTGYTNLPLNEPRRWRLTKF